LMRHRDTHAHNASYLSTFPLPSSAAHRNQHSFPTRRSSDLRIAPKTAAVGIADYLVADDDKQNLAFRPPSQPQNPRLTEIARRSDRKSTRLNSSHVEISYAVFCLKKKNAI